MFSNHHVSFLSTMSNAWLKLFSTTAYITGKLQMQRSDVKYVFLSVQKGSYDLR